MKRLGLLVLALFLVSSLIAQNRYAVLVIDIQKFYFPGGSLPLVEPQKAAENALQVIQTSRNEHNPVIYIKHNARTGTDIPDIIKPAEGEKIFTKDEANSFLGTGLYDHLKSLQVDTLVICGMQTHMCVEAAVTAAHDYGFHVILIHDACATRDLEFEGRVVSAADVQTTVLGAMKSYATILSTKEWVKEQAPADKR